MWNSDYKDILQSFSDGNVEFILVGAYALAAHGLPRATMDIDLWVNPTMENAARVYAAIGQFGAPVDQVTQADFARKDTIFQIGVAPRRIDLITGIDAVNFDDALRDAIEIEIEGITLKILSIRHLIQNKLATGRHKDLDDVENLRKHINERPPQ
jgi:predicted nucleotidyltransferase